MTAVEYWFDFSCPYAYLGSTQIEAVAARRGAEVAWRPMLLGGVFRAIGTPDVPASVMPAAKARHNALDMMRWADLFGMPLRIPAGHPLRTVRALRGLLALPEPAWPSAIHAVFRAYWARGIDISTADGLALSLGDAGIPPRDLERCLAANDDPDIKAELHRRTDEAVARGVFGAPAMFVGARMFWGQDRLDMVGRALAGWHPEIP
jgi:2-hydroxychromene-2-carboxylate isomerase